MVQLVGEQPNPLAIGARVSLLVGERVLVQEVRSGGSYLYQSDLRLHFGLGEAGRVDRLFVRWPGGAERILEDLPADQFLTVSEK